ncbi:thioredoxin-like domain-containing protein [Dysgonomonas reticulitermitis]
MRSKIFCIALSLLFIFNMEAQNIKNAFKLEADIPQIIDKLYFGQYWIGQSYAIDSVIPANGKAIFTREKQPDPGEYFLYSKTGLLINLLLDKGQDNVCISVNPSDTKQSKISGSEDTRLLWEYQTLSQKAEALKKKLTQKPNKEETDELKRLQDNILQLTGNHSGTWFAAYTKGDTPISLPFPTPKNVDEFYSNKHYGRIHYFDNMDLTDPRLWRSSYLIPTINTYMSTWVEQYPDSLATAASELVAKTKGNDICFKEMLSYFTNTALESKTMGNENVWAKLYEDYIRVHDVPWITTEQRGLLSQKYETIKMNRIGMTAQSLQLETIDGKPINTGEIEADYLILYFYDHDCSHCQETIPKAHDLYKAYKDKGVRMVTIDINNNKEQMISFIEKHNLRDWINCADAGYKSKFWIYYNVSGVPSIYIIDKDKKIIAKNIDNEGVKKVLEFYIR